MKTDQPAPQPQRPTGNRKVFDVRRPGKAPASPTSRPIIVGHQAQAARTQVSVSGIGERGLGEQLLDSHKKIEIAAAPQPAETALVTEPSSDVPAVSSVPPPEPVAALPPQPAAADAEPAKNADDKKSKEATKKDEPAIESVRDPDEPIDDAELAELAVEGPEAAEPLPPEPTPDEASTQPVQPSQPIAPAAIQTTSNPFTTAENEAATAHAAAMAMPAEEGAVIAEHGQKHILRTLLLILVLIAVVAFIFDILLDSGVVTLQAIPHTHFFGI